MKRTERNAAVATPNGDLAERAMILQRVRLRNEEKDGLTWA